MKKNSIKTYRRYYSILLMSLIVLLAGILSAQKDSRDPAVAGQFYPAHPQQLATDVQAKVDAATDAKIDGEILALVAPHAGYTYSGAIAASAYKQVAGQHYDVIIIVAPSHRDSFRGATIYPGAAYETPLGSAVIDRFLAQKLVNDCEHISFSELGHRAEHAIEVQLPFIQTVLPEIPIIPIDVGFVDWPVCQDIGKTIAQVIKDKRALLIASTDLYHGDSYETCKKVNDETLDAMLRLNPKQFFKGLEAEKYQACGGFPVVIVQVAAQALGADKATLLSRTNSNDVIGTKSGYVVGYGAVAFYKATTKSQSQKIEYKALDKQHQIEFIKMARASIEHYMRYKTIPEYSATDPVAKETRGVFVTLIKNGQLRGCIGHHESDIPLCQLVPQMAVSAAFGDPRFPPLQPEELDHIHIKVSIYLTNVYQIDSIDDFQMGVDGIILRKGQRGATFLPEVPLEAGWKSVDEELYHLCLKAGLAPGAWKDGAEFWVYRTQVFDETVLAH